MMPKRTIKGSGKKLPLNMRTTAALRKKIEKAAGASGRSMVQEVEYRVEQSFSRDLQRAMQADLRSIERRLNSTHNFHDYLLKRFNELHEAIALVAILLRDRDLSIGEHQRLRALTDKHGFRPTNGEARHG